MKAAISGETLGSVIELEEILKIFKRYGIQYIEIWPENIPVQCGKKLLHKRLYANRDVDRAKELLKKYNIKVACVCFGAGFDQALAMDKELFSNELERAVEVAYKLDAKIVNHYCYYVAMDEKTPLEFLQGYYEKAIKKAEDLNIYLALENEAHDITKDPQKLKEIVEYINSPNFKTNFDATNYYQAGFEGFPYAYEVLKNQIIHVHIKNGCIYHPEFGHDSLCRGGAMSGLLEGNEIYYPYASDGAVNIDGLLMRLEKDGYGGFCSMEPHTTPELCLKFYEIESAYVRNRGVLE